MPLDAPIALDRVSSLQEMRQDRIALDRAASSRTIDSDGHLHVKGSAISKANVCGYLGREIPDYDKLKLDPDRVYQLLRDPGALEKSASSFNGKPLLILHRPQSADDHDHEIVVGSLNNVRYDAPYLRADLSVWDGDAISLINSGEQRELSCGYRYEPIMEPGTYQGQHIDGRMIGIVGNHCALVSVGRAGPDVFVGDAQPDFQQDPIPDSVPELTPALPPVIVQEDFTSSKEISEMPKANAALSRQATFAAGALRAYLLPKMAADSKIDLKPFLKNVNATNWKTQKPKVATALDAALKKMAVDATAEQLLDLLDQLEDMPDADIAANAPDETAEDGKAAKDADPDEDEDDEETKKKKAKEAAEKLKEAAADEDNDDDEDEDSEEDKKRKAKEAAEKLKEAAKDRKGARDKAAKDTEPTVTKAAMDAAIAQAVKLATDSASKAATKATMERLRSIADAEKAVRPYIGEVSGMDSAEAVYRMALDANAIDLTDVPAAAFPALVRMLPVPGEQKPQPAKTKIAADSAMIATRSAMFPNANRLRNTI